MSACERVQWYSHTFERLRKNTTEADHAPMWLDLNISPEKPENVVVLNFKYQTGQHNFIENTSNYFEIID